ncbi:hypothetical protein PQX77_007756 [Marasmius sp. AFHP31]|nr:hypothetical protein PQX77_007756 [Marasmius sp. AFHP31]
MAMKRKFDFDDASYNNSKQQKLVPFPQYGSDDNMDSMMTEAEPFHAHTRFSSNASSTSSDASSPPTTPPFVYPSLDIYPVQDVAMHSDDLSSSPQAPPSPVGLLQPTSAFQHHGECFISLVADEPTFGLLEISGPAVLKSRNSESPAHLD